MDNPNLSFPNKTLSVQFWILKALFSTGQELHVVPVLQVFSLAFRGKKKKYCLLNFKFLDPFCSPLRMTPSLHIAFSFQDTHSSSMCLWSFLSTADHSMCLAPLMRCGEHTLGPAQGSFSSFSTLYFARLYFLGECNFFMRKLLLWNV